MTAQRASAKKATESRKEKFSAKPASIEPSTLGLRRVKLLDGLPEDALEQLAHQCRWKPVPAEQRVISRAAQDQDVYLVVSGRVRVTSFSAAGRQVTYRDIEAGDWFGELSALDGLSRSADVVALDNTLVAAMSPSTFNALMHEHPAVCNRVLLRLAASVRELTERVFDLSTLGVQNRLHAELLRLARQAGVTANSASLNPAPKHSDLASQVSTYREQVTRELSAMAKQGVVQHVGRTLVIPDVAKLEKIVNDVRYLP